MTRPLLFALVALTSFGGSAACVEIQDFGAASSDAGRHAAVDGAALAPADAGTDSGDGGAPALPDGALARGPTTVAPQWQLLNPLPTANDLRAIWGVADNDIWVAGTHGAVLRWDGATFHQESPPGVDETLYGLWASSDDDVWALGSGEGNNPQVLHWDGSTWTSNFSLNGFDSVRATSSISGSGPDNVWVTGVGTAPAARWQGTGWLVDLWWTEGGQEFGPTVNDVWTFGANDTWLVGDAGIVHFDGSTWTIATSSQPASSGGPFGPENHYVGVWGQASDDVWSVFTSTTGLGVSHWDGTSWSVQATSGTIASDVNWTCRNGSCGRMITGGAGNVFVTLPSDGPFSTWSYSGMGWSVDQMDTTDVVVAGTEGSGMNALWADATGTLFAASNFGAVARRDAVSFEAAAQAWNVSWTAIDSAFRFELGGVSVGRDGSAWAVADPHGDTPWLVTWGLTGWTPAPAPPFQSPQYVWVNTASDVWTCRGVVDASVQLAHWDGSVWRSFPVPSSQIGPIWSDGPDDLWGLGSPGDDDSFPSNVLHWDGRAWATLVGKPGVGFFLLSGSSTNDIWIDGADTSAGDHPVLFHWDGQTLAEVDGAPAVTGPIWANGPTDVWVGSSHFDGHAWSTLPGDAIPVSIWGSGPSDVWFVLDNQSIEHWNGSSLEWPASTPEGRLQTSVSGSGPDDVWTVGGGGATYRFSPPAGASVPH